MERNIDQLSFFVFHKIGKSAEDTVRIVSAMSEVIMTTARDIVMPGFIVHDHRKKGAICVPGNHTVRNGAVIVQRISFT